MRADKTATFLQNGARYILLLIGSILFAFALLSGSEDYGGGFGGLLKNSPNALPWLLFIALVALSWKQQLLAGVLITVFGAAMVYFLNFSGPNFWWITFITTALIPLMGIALVISAIILKRKT